MELEKRYLATAPNPEGNSVAGVALPYATETRINGTRERVMPGAFSASLTSGADILMLLNHDPRALLARTRSGTLVFEDGPDALRFTATLPQTPSADEARGLMESGDLGGVSIGFVVERGGERRVNGVREITQARLVEVSLVSAFAAYPATSAQLRASKPRLDRVAQRARVL